MKMPKSTHCTSCGFNVFQIRSVRSRGWSTSLFHSMSLNLFDSRGKVDKPGGNAKSISRADTPEHQTYLLLFAVAKLLELLFDPAGHPRVELCKVSNGDEEVR